MARTYISGFDIGHQVTDGFNTSAVFSGTVSYETTITRSGTGKSIKVNPASSAVGRYQLSNTFFPTYVRFFIRVTSLPSVARVICGDSGGANLFNLLLNTNGTVAFRSNVTTIATSTKTLTTTTYWYMIEVKTTSTTADTIMKITDATGTENISGTVTLTGTTFQLGCPGTEASAITMYFDDLSGDDTTWCGFCTGISLALPISDNARAAKWTGGAGGTTNLWQGVDNTPPVGLVSASATNTSQIEHAGGGAGNEDYDANLTTYASLGIAAADTIIALAPVVVDGEDIATGTKTLTFGIKSNPAGSFEANFSAGGDVGAVGTFPTNWTAVRRAALISSPSVTVSSSPVMTARRPGVESRVASFCFMGMYVEWLAASFVGDEDYYFFPQQTPIDEALTVFS